MALAGAAEQRITSGAFSAQNLANTAWSFAKAGRSDMPLFAALAKAAETQVYELSAQKLAQISSNPTWIPIEKHDSL